MSNPLNNEKAIYEQLKRDKVTIHPLIWNTLTSRIYKNLKIIYRVVACLKKIPGWITESSYISLKMLYESSGEPGHPPDELIKIWDCTLRRADNIKNLLARLQPFVADIDIVPYSESEVYKVIERENIRIDPRIWGLLSHHIHNDLNVFMVGVSLVAMTPSWMLERCSVMIERLCEDYAPGCVLAEGLCQSCKAIINAGRDIKMAMKEMLPFVEGAQDSRMFIESLLAKPTNSS